MRKALLSFTLIAVVCFANAAGTADAFRLDEQKIATELADLNEVEAYVNSSNATLSQMYAENNSLAVRALVPSYGATSIAADSDGPPLGIPSMVWGFCFGILGVAFVYILTESKGETKKAFWGCVISAVVWTFLNFTVFATSTI
jgi:hypothetical protein